MLLKFLFSIRNSSSVSISGTFTSKIPLLIFFDAFIKFIIGLVSLSAKDIAMIDEINRSKQTIRIYITAKVILIPSCLFSIE